MAALQKGEYEAILTSGEGALDALAQLACELEVFEAVELIEVERERSGVPDELALRTLAVLPFVEAMSLSAAANTLFEDAGVLLQLGYTAVQIQEASTNGEERERKRNRPNPGRIIRMYCVKNCNGSKSRAWMRIVGTVWGCCTSGG